MTTSSRTAKLATFLTILAASDAFAPVGRVQSQRQHVVLSAARDDGNDGWKNMAGGAAAFVTGLGFMAQVAFADPTSFAAVEHATSTQTESSSLLLSIGAPTFGAGASFETLDFSLPSYDQAVGGDVIKPAAKEAPSDTDTAAAKAAAKEEAQAAKEEAKRAAADKKEAERAEKAAAEAKKQEEADAKAAKEADKEARKAAEREKQRQAVERQKAAKDDAAAPSVSVPDIKDIKIPDVPKLDVPDIKDIKMPEMPKIDVPKFDIPKVDVPKFDAPAVSMPKFDVPKLSAPSVDFKAPEIPDVKLPSFSMPRVDMPKLDVPAVPSFDMPKAPSFDMPKVPAAPSFNVPSKSSAPAASFDAPTESQEVRDARAAAKKTEFNDADSAAREAEKAAKLARDKANDVKKEFKAAKAEACATRPGGKLICLRGFGVGY